MNLGSSYDENGPLVFLGQATFSAETGLPSGRQDFEVPAYLVASEESQCVVSYDGMKLSDFGTFNDYYGFGTSAITTLYEAKKTIERLNGCNVDIEIRTELTLVPCFPSSDKPFYNGAQRIHHIPMTWREESGLCKKTVEKFVVWHNGQRTTDALRFYDRIIELAESDAAPSRNGELLTVASRNNAVSRDDFLKEKHPETA